MLVHHLDHSRSFRVIWLLEELGATYDVVRHRRLPGMRAPPSLKALHPTGKAPLLVDDGHVIAESQVILSYINAVLGGSFCPDGPRARVRHDELFAFVEASGMPPLMSTLLGRLTKGFSPLMWRVVRDSRDEVLARVELALGDTPFVCGETMTLADIQMAFLVEFAHALGLLAGRAPVLERYRQRLCSRPAHERARERAGPMVGVFPQEE